jgi:hypothetical protein
MKLKLQCPGCHAVFNANQTVEDRQEECPNCRQLVRIAGNPNLTGDVLLQRIASSTESTAENIRQIRNLIALIIILGVFLIIVRLFHVRF